MRAPVSQLVRAEEPCSVEEKEDFESIIGRDNTTVSDFWRDKYEREAAKNWDLFYKRNTTNFFKDRHYLDKEFPEISEAPNDGRVFRILMEFGCGVGNSFFPLLEKYQHLFVFACDFSKRAIELVQSNPEYHAERCNAFVCDLTSDQSLPVETLGKVDIATMIFVLSAISPEKMLQTLVKVNSALRPGGVLVIRDYGRYDMAQLRFKPGNMISDSFYVRGDGTRAYYFTIEEISKLLKEAGFSVDNAEYHRKTIINRKQEKEMRRVWIQVKCHRPDFSDHST